MIVGMNDSKIKKIAIAALMICIFIMSIAYANLFQQLKINGNASVVASWKVEIVGIKEGTIVGNASSISTPSYTTSTARFDVKLTSVSDSIEYLVSIKNSGDMEAKLDSIITNKTGSNAIVYEILGVNEGDILKKDETTTVRVKVAIDPNIGITEDNINTEMMIIFNYMQSL